MRENECSGLKSVSFHVVRRSVGQKRSGPAPCVRLGVVEGGGGGRVTVVAYGDGQRALQWQLSPWMYLQGGCPSLTAKDPFWLLSGCVGTWWYAVPCSPGGLTSPQTRKSSVILTLLAQTRSLHWRQLLAVCASTHSPNLAPTLPLSLSALIRPETSAFTLSVPHPSTHDGSGNGEEADPVFWACSDICAPTRVASLLWEERQFTGCKW